jgi:tRNA(Ser,Leu) C12 N-acetylase TAN1
MQKYQLAKDVQVQVLDRIATFIENIAEEYILEDVDFLVKCKPDEILVEVYNG